MLKLKDQNYSQIGEWDLVFLVFLINISFIFLSSYHVTVQDT